MNERQRTSARERIAPEARRFGESDARRPRIGADVASAVVVISAAAHLDAQTWAGQALPAPVIAALHRADTAGVSRPAAAWLAEQVCRAWSSDASPAIDAPAVAVACAARAICEHASTRGAAGRALAKVLHQHERSIIGWLAAHVTHVDPDIVVSDAIDAAAEAGLDGERLAWAAITAETRRHYGLVRERARRLAANLPDRSADDLVGYGWEGLRTALRHYDPVVSAFTTYAVYRIDGRIRDGVRAENPVPKRLTTVVNKHARAIEDLTQALGRPPVLEEIAAQMGEHAAYLHLMPRLTPAASLEELAGGNDEERREPDCLVDNADTADLALHAALMDAVRDAVERLDPREALLIRRLWLEEATPAQVRGELGLDSSGFAAAQSLALAHLSDELSTWRDDS